MGIVEEEYPLSNVMALSAQQEERNNILEVKESQLVVLLPPMSTILYVDILQ